MKKHNKALTESMPLTLPQLEIWMAQTIYADLPIYNLAAYIPIQAKIDPERFKQAVISLVQLHDTLRITLTRPKTDDGLPRQHINPSFPVPFQVWDYSKKKNPHHFAQDWMSQRCDEPFTLYASPLFRFDLIKISENRWYFFHQYHHIIMDGESYPLIYQTLAKLYTQSGSEPSEQGVYSYTAYIEDDLAYRTSERYARDAAYWQEQCATPGELLLQPRYSLLTKAPLANTRAVLTLSRERYQALHALAERLEATFLSLLASVLYVYFNRTSQKNTLTIALAVHNRSYTKFKKTAGLFAKILPLWFDFNAELNFDELVKKTQRRIKEHLRHHRYPATQRIGKQNRTPFSAGFDVSLSYMTRDRSINFSGNQAQPIPLQQDYRLTPLSIQIYVPPTTGNVEIECTYNQAYFSEQDIRLLVRRLDILLESVITEPSSKVNELPIWDDEERKQVLQTWNATARPYPKNHCVHQLFEEQVICTPDTTALVFGDQQLSYGELNRKANRVAHSLIESGVGPDVLVGLSCERSPDMIAGLLGILKAGGAYVPIDPGYPEARIRYLLEDSGIRLLLTQSPLLETLPRIDGIERRCLDTLETDPGWSSYETNPPAQAGLEHLAYINYTSGSTGQPKAALIEQRGIVRLVASPNFMQFDQHTCMLQLAPISFDAATLEIWGPLSHGGRLVIMPPGPSGIEEIANELKRNEVNSLWLTAGLFHQMVDKASEALGGIEYLLAGGDVLSPEHVLKVLKAHPHCRLINGYGPTENTTFTCCHQITADEDLSEGVPIGRPIANTEVYVLDTHRQPVPVGIPGELYIGGAGLARGYLNRPELTAERFVELDVFGERKRLYRTGDRVSWRADGNLQFLGRLDHQVKLRGYRIEPGEIEALLREHAEVSDALVTVTGEGEEKQLLSYVIATPAREAAVTTELRAALKFRLPSYMVPAAILVMEHWPLTPNGKIDRGALPLPGRNERGGGEYVPPLGEAETLLADLWSDVLSLEQVGREDNFFELGGNSLMAVQVTSRVIDIFGVDIGVRALFEAPRLSALADHIQTTMGIDVPLADAVPPNLLQPGIERITPDQLPLIELDQKDIDRIVATVSQGAANVADIYPLTPLQEGILFHHRERDQGDTYILSALLRMEDRQRCDTFLAALRQVIERHDVMRTAFVWKGLHEPAQVVWRSAPLHVETRTFNADEASIAEQLCAYADPRHWRMDLTQAPLIHVILAPDGDAWLALLLWHHLNLDHTTMELIFTEIGLIWQGKADRLAPPVPYRNFVSQSRRIPVSDHETYFRDRLGSIDTPTLPYGLADTRLNISGVREMRRALPDKLARDMRMHSRRHGVTPATLSHLAWGLVLSRLCDQETVAFGTVLFGRLQGGKGIEQVLGLFINTLPIPIDCGNLEIRQALKETQRELLGLIRHEHAPLVLAQRCSGVPAGTPLFSTLLNYRHSRSIGDGGPRLEGVELIRAQERTNYPLTLSVDDWGDGFSLDVQAVAPIAPQQVCSYMEQALSHLVDALEHNPEQTLHRVEILTQTEKSQLQAWGKGSQTESPNQTVVSLFESQAKARPQTTALIFGARQLSYGELNRKANRVAHSLIESGVGPDVLVGLSCERSLDMIAGLLGILKAGGAYVPIDPGYPEARIRYLLEDSGIRLLLTQTSLLEQLPQPEGLEVLCLDPLETDHYWSGNEANPQARAKLDDLAYVIYTSGSTGNPKGVMIEHRALINFLNDMQRRTSLKKSSRVLALTTLSFDIAALELFLPLITEGCVDLVSSADAKDPAYLITKFERDNIRLAQATPTTWKMMLDAGWQKKGDYTLLCGGETLSPDVATRLSNISRQLWNVYGPTETTIWSTASLITGIAEDTITIGSPIANTEVYVLDTHFQPVPIGIPGELYIGGLGLARGYLNRPELTAERFVELEVYGELRRLYRTGDRVSWRADGNLMFLGRLDYQIKLRGYRIEPGEIEALLREHTEVSDTMVTVIGEGEEKQLLGYVIAEPDRAEQEQARDIHIERWRELYQTTYSAGQAGGDFDISGWNNSYTGEPIPAAQMAQWVKDTVERIRPLSGGRVLEIGCGTGLLLTRLAVDCERYIGLDFSTAVLERLGAYLTSRDDLGHVELRQGLAHDLSFLETDSVDLIILNSVVQYFPDLSYLLEVLRQAQRVCTPGGHLFCGDIRNLALLEAYLGSVQLYRAEEEAPLRKVQKLYRRALLEEEELLLDSGFFKVLAQHWPGIRCCRIHLKAGNYDNELSRFRYDVIVELGSEKLEACAHQWIGWDPQGNWRKQVRQALAARSNQAIGIRGLVDRRTSQAVATIRELKRSHPPDYRVGDLRDSLAATVPGTCPNEVYALARELGVKICWQELGSNGCYHVIFNPHWQGIPAISSDADVSLNYYRRYTNTPLRGTGDAKRARILKAYLEDRLPSYMVPSSILILERWPLTPNGKIDRGALPLPGHDERGGEEYVPPENEIETLLAGIWSEILGLDQVGREDNFFELGGHSLLSASLISRIDTVFGKSVPLRTFFEDPTIAALSKALSEHSISGNTPPEESGTTNTAVPKTSRLLIPELYRKLLSYVGSWHGERANMDSLVLGRYTDGSRPPLFWVFQGEKEFRQLSDYSGSDQPLYGMRSGHLVMDYSEDNVQALSLDYVREIESLRPHGPLVIGGNCQGAYIALAIAQHLLRRGRHLPLVILMEWSFKPQPYAGPVGLIFGRESTVANPYLYSRNPELMWRRSWPDHRVVIIPGAHGQFFDEPNIQRLSSAVRQMTDQALQTPPLILPTAAANWLVTVTKAPNQLQPGEPYELHAQVTNTSPIDWPDGGEIGLVLANQWLNADLTSHILKDGAVPLPALYAGASAKVVLPISAPNSTGLSYLDLRVVEEGVAWHNEPVDPLDPLRLEIEITEKT